MYLLLILFFNVCDVDVVLFCCEERAELEGKAIDLPANLRSYPYLWSWALGSD